MHLLASSSLDRARNPRWEPGMGMIPDPRQSGGGGGGGPPIPGKSGMGMAPPGWTPDSARVGSPANLNRGSGMGVDPRSPANLNRGSGMGMDPRRLSATRRVPSSCTYGQQNEPMPSFSGCHHPRKEVRRRHNDIRFRFRMLMLSAGLMLQCQLTY